MKKWILRSCAALTALSAFAATPAGAYDPLCYMQCRNYCAQMNPGTDPEAMEARYWCFVACSSSLCGGGGPDPL